MGSTGAQASPCQADWRGQGTMVPRKNAALTGPVTWCSSPWEPSGPAPMMTIGAGAALHTALTSESCCSGSGSQGSSGFNVQSCPRSLPFPAAAITPSQPLPREPALGNQSCKQKAIPKELSQEEAHLPLPFPAAETVAPRCQVGTQLWNGTCPNPLAHHQTSAFFRESKRRCGGRGRGLGQGLALA